MKKIALFLSCITWIFITGCAKSPQEPKLTTVTIAFQDWVGYGPFYLAQEKGFCKQEGIDLVIIEERLDSARRDTFKQGMLDCEAGTIDLLVSKVAQNTPIVAVMEIDQSFGGDAIVAADNIKTLDDLAGKRLALARDDVGETFISVLFYKNRLSFHDLTLVPESAEKVGQAFLDGQADACVTWEPQVTQALQRPGAHILASSKEFPGIIIDTLNVRRDLVKNNPRLIKGLMRAWFKALDFYKKYPNEASEMIAKYYNISPGQYRKQVQGLRWDYYEVQRFSAETQEWLEAFNAIAAVKLGNARILEKPDAPNFLNHELLEKLYENIK